MGDELVMDEKAGRFWILQEKKCQMAKMKKMKKNNGNVTMKVASFGVDAAYIWHGS